MRIAKASFEAAEYACLYFHYAKAVPVCQVAYSVFNDDDEWCGVIIYGSGATPHIASPYDKLPGQVVELERVALNGKQGHGTTSKAVSMTLKALQKEAPWIDLVVSYADLDQGHAGTLYQATNWIYQGLTNANQRGAFIINGKKYHPKSVHSKGWKQSLLWLRENIDPGAQEFITKGKHKYLYPMTKQMRKRVEVLSVPYPKKIGGDTH
jgi:hypothetical protein